MSKFSVVIPLYNHARYIEQAVQSVLSQTLPAAEIIIIDDGSRDDGAKLAEQMLADYPLGRVIRQDNRGAHTTINTLVELAQSDYVAILNSDDIFSSNKLKRCADIIARSPRVDIIVGEVELIDENGKPLTEGPAADWLRRAVKFRDTSALPQLSVLYENWAATTSNFVFSKAFWRSHGGFQNLRYCHDLDFLQAGLASGCVEIDRGITHIFYRVHPANTIVEAIEKVRLEIASVWAVALRESGPAILEGFLDRPFIDYFFQAFESKDLRSLVSLLQAMYGGFRSRGEFYDFVLRSERSPMLREFLR
jgi:glycosyltransferase involved in cell wall biosynthesis